MQADLLIRKAYNTWKHSSINYGQKDVNPTLEDENVNIQESRHAQFMGKELSKAVANAARMVSVVNYMSFGVWFFFALIFGHVQFPFFFLGDVVHEHWRWCQEKKTKKKKQKNQSYGPRAEDVQL